MRCGRVRKRLQPLVDGVLPPTEAAEIQAHLRACAACRAEFEALRSLDYALSGEPVVEPPRGMAAAIVGRAQARFSAGAPVLVPRWLEALTVGGLALALVAAAVTARAAAATPVMLRSLGFNLGEVFFAMLCIGLAVFGSLYYGSRA